MDHIKTNNTTIPDSIFQDIVLGNNKEIAMWLIEEGYVKKNNEYAINIICDMDINCVNTLQELHEAGLICEYNINALKIASVNRRLNVLNWWLNSGLELKYDHSLIRKVMKCGHIDVLNWWSNSGLQLKFDKNTHLYAGEDAIPDIRQWWLDNKDHGIHTSF